MEERIIELVIASTPIEALQGELLGKAKGYKLTDTPGLRMANVLKPFSQVEWKFTNAQAHH